MYKGMSEDIYDRSEKERIEKENGGRPDQLKYYPGYRTRTERLQNKKNKK